MKQQRGVALVIALLVVALAVLVVAALVDAGELTKARVRNGWRAEQGRQLLGGVEAWAAAGLLADQRASGAVDGLTEAWARPMPALELPQARIEGRLHDLGGCFNLNALAPGGIADPLAVRRFARLLHALRLPQALATQAGARVAGAALFAAGELRQLPAMTADAWRQLAPLVCAVPRDQGINLNTAPPALWQALDDAITPAMAARLFRGEAAPYPDLAAVRQALQREGVDTVDLRGCGVGSHYFVVESEITVDAIAFRYTSQLQRLPGTVRVIARARGRMDRGRRP